MEVNETAVYCRLLLGLQSPTLNFLDLIQQEKALQKYNYIMWLIWIWHENNILLAINDKFKGWTL